MTRPIVIIESPYAGDIGRNVRYARAAMHHSLMNGECPFASHLLYTQPGILDDLIPQQRMLGIECGFRLWQHASLICFYTDLGWSSGMKAALERATNENRIGIEFRQLGDEWQQS